MKTGKAEKADRGEMTNAVREALRAGVTVTVESYEVDLEDLSAAHAASTMGIDPARLYKTLVLMRDGRARDLVVVSVPALMEVDPKALARVIGAGRVDMVPLKDLFDLTGYQRGGCSPLGMKRRHPYVLHDAALTQPTITVSAGRRGLQMTIAPADLLRLTGGVAAAVARRAPEARHDR